MTLPIHVALVSEESAITLAELTQVAAALQKQVLRDFAPIWNVTADVSAFASFDDLPLDYWPIAIADTIGDPTAVGYHEDQHGQPFALVQYTSDWSLTASHELLEMLGDPFGRRMIAGASPIASQGRVKFLVEVCDPSEASDFAYKINGISVSDFYTPHFFDPESSSGARYSFTGAIKHPRQVLKGGYLTWYSPALKQWWQRSWFSGNAPKDRQLKNVKAKNGNLRAAIDRLTAEERIRAMHPRGLRRARTRQKPGAAIAGRAADLRTCIREVKGA